MSVVLQELRIAAVSSAVDVLLIALIFWGFGFGLRRFALFADWNPKAAAYTTALVGIGFAVVVYVGNNFA